MLRGKLSHPDGVSCHELSRSRTQTLVRQTSAVLSARREVDGGSATGNGHRYCCFHGTAMNRNAAKCVSRFEKWSESFLTFY